MNGETIPPPTEAPERRRLIPSSSCKSSSSVATFGSVPPPAAVGPSLGSSCGMEVKAEDRLSVAAGSKLPSNSLRILCLRRWRT